MKESVGNAFLFQIVIIFTIVMMIFLLASLNYVKGFKAKNRIIEILERDNGKFSGEDITIKEIDEYLQKLGYKYSDGSFNPCKNNSSVETGASSKTYSSRSFDYCIRRIEYPETSEYKSKYYYEVTTYVIFDIPLVSSSQVGQKFSRFKINSQTKYFKEKQENY